MEMNIDQCYSYEMKKVWLKKSQHGNVLIDVYLFSPICIFKQIKSNVFALERFKLKLNDLRLDKSPICYPKLVFVFWFFLLFTFESVMPCKL